MTALDIASTAAKCGPLALLLVASAAFWLPGCGGAGGAPEGGSAATEVRQFAVEGMSCEGCVSTVTSAIKGVPGVASVDVSLEKKNAVVTADFAKATPSAIEAAVKDAGYGARPIEPQKND